MTLLIQNLDYTVSFLCLLFALHMMWVKADNPMPARLLGCVFFLLAAQAILLYLISLVGRPSLPAVLLPAMPLLLGPAIFFFFKSAATPDFKFKAMHSLSLIPAFLAVVMMAISFFLEGVDYLILLSEFSYLAALVGISFKGKRYFSIAGIYAATIYRWLVIAIVYLLAIFVADLMIYFEVQAGGAVEASVSLFVTLVFKLGIVGFLLFLALQNSPYFEWIYTTDVRIKKRSEKALSKGEEAAYRAIIEVFEKEISRLNSKGDVMPGLRDMAYRLEVPIRQLSKAVNHVFGESYSRHLNRRRVEWAKGYIEAHPETAMIDVMFESGFHSKSSFNKEFKSIEGMSPSEFRDSLIRS